VPWIEGDNYFQYRNDGLQDHWPLYKLKHAPTDAGADADADADADANADTDVFIDPNVSHFQ